MRVLLRVFVLATAAVAWAAGAQTPISSRAATTLAPADSVAGYAHAPQDALLPESTALDEASVGPAQATRHGIADVEIALSEPVPQPVDAVPVDVIVVDGESGEVLRCATTTVQRGPEGAVMFEVAAPDGYISVLTGERRVEGYVSRRADRVRVIEPLRREADIRVRVVDVAGRPVEGAKVAEVLLGGGPPPIVALASAPADTELPVPEASEVEEDDTGPRLRQAWSEPTGADGWTRVRGVPHLLDEHYWVVVGKRDVEAFTEVRLGAFGERLASEILLPVASTRTVTANSAIGICGGCGSGYRCSSRGRWIPATLEVLFRREGGRMAAGLEVWVGTKKGITDAWGRVTFEGLRPGSYDIDVRDPDFVWSKESVELSDGEWRTFVFSERPGWTARAVLLDSVGRPVPFARVTVDSQAPVAYVRLEDGIQDLAFHTDANGAISLPGMHHAPVSLGFSYGSRWQRVTLAESDPSATVRLPPP